MQDIEQLIRDAWKAGARHARTTPESPDSETLEAHIKEALAPRIPLSVSWEFIRDEYRFAVQHADGTVEVSTLEPFVSAGIWDWPVEAEVYSAEAIKGTIKSTLPWYKTLIERPPAVPYAPPLGIDWSQVPEEFNYAAMDEDGGVYAYGSQPAIVGHEWANPCPQRKLHFIKNIPYGTRPLWTETLTARPKTQ